MLTAAVVALLVLAIGALTVHDDPQTEVSLVTQTTTTKPAPVSTTAPPPETTTTAAPVVTTAVAPATTPPTTAKRAATTVAPAPSTTQKPVPTFALSAPSGNGNLVASGTQCLGEKHEAVVSLYKPDGKLHSNQIVVAAADGTWQAPVTIPGQVGTVWSVKGQCVTDRRVWVELGSLPYTIG